MEVDFSFALRQLKTGSKLTRVKWDKISTYIEISTAITPEIYLKELNRDKTPYSPAQEDLFAEDWIVVK